MGTRLVGRLQNWSAQRQHRSAQKMMFQLEVLTMPTHYSYLNDIVVKKTPLTNSLFVRLEAGTLSSHVQHSPATVWEDKSVTRILPSLVKFLNYGRYNHFRILNHSNPTYSWIVEDPPTNGLILLLAVENP